MFKTKTYQDCILDYRKELELDDTTLETAVEDLIFSHKWLNYQISQLLTYRDQLEEQGVLDPHEHGKLDIFEFFRGIDIALLQREAMLRVIKNFKLEAEYTKELENLLEEK